MITLNLAKPGASDIKYKISSYPDGQQDIKIENPELLLSYDNPNVLIQSRFNSFRDLEIIICATKALRNLDVDDVHLYIPYILGARSDRQFVFGGTSYLRDIVAPILNAQNYKSVTCIDAHSDVAAACINKLKVEDNSTFFKSILKPKNTSMFDSILYDSDFVLVSPDAGAMKKIYNLAEKIGYTKEIITASKHRDIVTGKIVSTNVPLNDDELLCSDTHYVIVDDICDGGRTFIEIAKVIKQKTPKARISLVVTHGIFSAGFDELKKWFNNIYCTNSVKDIEKTEEYGVLEFVQQINVF